MTDTIGPNSTTDSTTDTQSLKSGARGKRVRFTSAQQNAVKKALKRDLRIRDEAVCDEILNEIVQSGAVRTFGYGSLISDPHVGVDSIKKARLKGWARGFVCYDPFYSGTWSEPGLCLGLEADDASHTNGAVLENDFSSNASCPKAFSKKVVEHLEKLAVREMPVAEPLYCFRFLEVRFAGGKSHKALVCVADTTSRLYAGQGLTLEERAEIIARSHGVIPARNGKPEYRYSNMEYIRECIHGILKMGDRPCPKMVELLSMANAIRRELDDDLRNDLESFESRNYHPSVYL